MLIKEDDNSRQLSSENENSTNIINEFTDLKLMKDGKDNSGKKSDCLLTVQINGKISGVTLRCLNFSGQNLTTFEVPVGYLFNVTDVDLSHNSLSNISDSFKCMPNVRKLDLSFNRLTVVPDCLYSSLNRVKALDLSHNRITDFSLQPLCLPFLCNLNVSYNNLQLPPLWLLSPDNRKSKYLDTVNLSFNPCLASKLGEQYNPHSWRKIADNVNNLILSNTGLTVRNAAFVKNFRNVKKFVLSNAPKSSYGNLLTDWPTLWWDMEVKEVDVSGCWMGDVSNLVSRLPGLTSLDVSHNEISWLPESITSLHLLTTFKASSSSLIFLPKNVGSLHSLKNLHLPHNNINSLPESIYNLKNLETLDLYNNYISIAPDVHLLKKLKGFDVSHNICETAGIRNYEALKNYLRSNILNGMARCDNRKIPEKPADYGSDEDYYVDSESQESSWESEETCVSGSSESEDGEVMPEQQCSPVKSEEEDWLEENSSNIAQTDDYDETDFVEETEDDIIKRAEVMYSMHFYLPYQQPPKYFGAQQNFWDMVGKFHVAGQFEDR